MKNKALTIKIIVFVLTSMLLFTSVACEKTKKEEVKPFNSAPIVVSELKSVNDKITGDQLMLVNNRVSKYQVVYPNSSSSVENYAVDFLISTIKSSTGATLNTVKDIDVPTFNDSDYYIYVGKTSQFEDADIAFNSGELGDDGFVIANKGNCIFIKGGGEMGHLYGVQEFLHYEINFEAYADDEIYFDKVSSVGVLDYENMTVVPSFAFRRVGTSAISDTTEGALLRDYVSGLGSTFAGSIWSALQYHSIAQFVENKEWFNNGQLCLSNEDALDSIAPKIAKVIKEANPTTKYFELGNADAPSTCGCVDCVASANANGGQGGVYIIWLNKLAEKIEQIFKEENFEKEYYLVGLCYLGYSAPPVEFSEITQKYEPVNENVICRSDVAARFCTIHACSTHAFNNPDCAINSEGHLADQVAGWGAVTKNSKLMLYMYGTEFRDYFFFYNDICSMKANAKFLKESGATDMYMQMESNKNAPFGQLRAYLLSKLWWNVDNDMDTLINDFFHNYYKEASGYMLEYFNAIQANFVDIGIKMESGGCMGYNKIGGEYMNVNYWTFELLQSYSKLIDKAYKAIEDANYSPEEYEKLRLRILADEMFVQDLYVKWHSNKFADPDKLRSDFIENNKLLGNSYKSEGSPLK